MSYQDEYQINGSAAHEAVDNGRYSDSTSVLQAICVYSEKYDLFGKIDLFDCRSGVLTERKKKISTIFDGYIFQLYAQFFSLVEMGYEVKEMRLYSMDDNKSYPVDLPEKNPGMLEKFEKLIFEMQHFEFDDFKQTNGLKCKKCIYEPLCSFSCEKQGRD